MAELDLLCKEKANGRAGGQTLRNIHFINGYQEITVLPITGRGLSSGQLPGMGYMRWSIVKDQHSRVVWRDGGYSSAGHQEPLQRRQIKSPTRYRPSVLQLRLQQRRTREQLADQGIMPPLKSPSAFHEQRKSLERAKTEDYLKHKIRSRPERSDLVNMHILQDSAAEGSIQSTQMKLKRARLADDLNEKIALRPGPLELVEKNIIPVDSAVKEAIKVENLADVFL
ncbi:hypothetical protein llap_5583 [Limosa lapponica baueri]|uniref:Phosphatase and actin regulator n=1 Tax=Limosa lapponica baueri TaxID=1758121 RepID=A0A2I0UDH2_LIMLA|nr:hypothetical protein llap_5583 [Limosa lapponica baueri]